jgi:hypothetical protein
MTCGAVKASDYGSVPHVCNLEAGHTGPHGTRAKPELKPYVTWKP